MGKSPPTWLIVFLGNPGTKYAKTRHNAGWLAADAVTASANVSTGKVKFKGLLETAEIGGATVLLLRPQTYMNLSGESAGPASKFYKIPPERVVVVHDDMDLPVGKLRIKRGGSDGGHNGIKSVTAHLGTKEYPRVKIGIDKPSRVGYDVIDWVTGKPSPSELEQIEAAAARVPELLSKLISEGVDAAMNAFNKG